MLLGVRFLVGVCSVNAFSYAADRLSFTEGDTVTVYLQLVDQNLDLPAAGFQPPYRRYVAAQGATLQVTMDALESSRQVVRQASRPFPLDGSIWSFQVSASDRLLGTVTLRLQLSEGGSVTNGVVSGGLAVQPKGI